jgi:hypothetical protein
MYGFFPPLSDKLWSDALSLLKTVIYFSMKDFGIKEGGV